MSQSLKRSLAISVAVAAFATSVAVAQETPPAPSAPIADPAVAPAAAPTTEQGPILNEDEMADWLNSQQQVKQGVTLTRTVDGAVVETKKETVTYSPDDPLRGTEAGISPIERLKAHFDSEVLARNEAIEETKLDFVIADLDRNDVLTADEFVFLVEGWQNASVTGAGRGRFVDPVVHADAASAKAEHAAQARAKFTVMSGGAGVLSRRQYTRAVMTDFDVFDADRDRLLRGDELLSFRAINRGETL